MRIALICDDYLPDSTRVSAKMMHELACELLEKDMSQSLFVLAIKYRRSKF